VRYTIDGSALFTKRNQKIKKYYYYSTILVARRTNNRKVVGLMPANVVRITVLRGNHPR